MALIGYGRVSTLDQHSRSQRDRLAEAGCGKIFIDRGVSGRLARRPELDKALDYARPGDVLVVSKLDRLGRSLRNLLELSALLAEREVNLRVLDQPIDTTTPAGRLFFALVAAFAEFERDLISERTRDGLAAARARGRTGGRPRALSPDKVTIARQMYDATAADGRRAYTVQQIASVVGCSRPTVYRALTQPAAAE
jgi:DNA invertase Pin-like site-specific DNA recombinase